MAEVLGAVASVVALLECAVKISGYLVTIKERHKDQDSIRQELSGITGVLFILKNQATASQDDPDTLQTLRLLDAPHGLLAQLKSLMAVLEKKLASGQGVKVLTWPLRKDEAKDILNALGRQQSLLNLALQGDHIQLSRAIKSEIAELNTQVADISEKVSEISIDQRAQEATRETEREARRRQAILEWLSPLNFQTRQNDLFAKSQIGSGQWFLDCSEFNSWLLRSGAILHGKGIPGAGKTFLASRIVQHVRVSLLKNKAAIACVYCDFQGSQSHSVESIMASIIEQFVRNLDPLPSSLVALHEQHINNRTRPTTDELEEMIHSIAKQGLRTWVVIDALDEYHDMLPMIHKLSKLQSWDTNVLITSRHSISLESHLRDVVVVEIRAHEDDLVQYVECRLPSLQCIQKRPDIQKVVTSEIIKAFLLARLHFDSLLDRSSPKAIKTALEEMPRGLQTLSQVYDGVMARIQDQTDYSRDQALTVLTWLFFARATLNPQELQHALAIEPNTDVFDEDNVSEMDSLVSVCKGLVSVDQESEVVRLSHYTTQEYFEKSSSPFLEHGQRMIATACLTYLTYQSLFEHGYEGSTSAKTDGCLNVEDDMADTRQNGSAQEKLIQRMPLFGYAAGHWGRHAVGIQDEVQNLALHFFCLSDARNETIAYVDFGNFYCLSDARNETIAYIDLGIPEILTDQSGNIRPAIQGVHLCAHFDLDLYLSNLLKNDEDCNAKDKFGRTPLYWATQSSNIRTIRLLLEMPDIDVNAGPEGDWNRHSPLAVAAEAGHTDVVALLLNQDDIAINAENYEGQTPLFLAARVGNTDIVQMLLKRQDTSPDTQDRSKRTALMIAAIQGHTPVVQLLLERNDININNADDTGRTSVFWAAEDGHKAIVDLFLKREDLDTALGDGASTLLTIAAKNNEEPMIQDLLQRENISINAIDTSGKTALMHATTNDNTNVVEMLLARDDIDTTVRTPLGHTALDYAYAQGRPDMIRLLTSAKAHEDKAQTAPRFTVLQLDKLSDHGKTLAIILSRRGINPNLQMHNGATSLHIAAAGGNAESVELLLMRDDLDPNIKNNTGRTPLSFAADQGYENVVRLLLLRKDIKPALEDYQGRNAMSYAVAKGFDAITKLLSSHDIGKHHVQ